MGSFPGYIFKWEKQGGESMKVLHHVSGQGGGWGIDATMYACFLIIRKNGMFIKIFKVSYREGGNTCVGDM